MRVRACVAVGAGVNIADKTGNMALHVVMASHRQQTSAKAFDKASTLHEVLFQCERPRVSVFVLQIHL